MTSKPSRVFFHSTQFQTTDCSHDLFFLISYNIDNTHQRYSAKISTSGTTAITNMSENTYNVTSEDVRKMESKESKYHGGDVPKDSDASAMKVDDFCRALYTPFG